MKGHKVSKEKPKGRKRGTEEGKMEVGETRKKKTRGNKG